MILTLVVVGAVLALCAVALLRSAREPDASRRSGAHRAGSAAGTSSSFWAGFGGGDGGGGGGGCGDGGGGGGSC